MFINISLKDLCQTLSEGSCSQISGIDISIHWMTSEILLFFVQSNADFHFIVDVFLWSILDPNVS